MQQNNEKRVAEILLKTGSVLFSPENPFTYCSGIYSPLFVDGRKICSYPEERGEVTELLVKTLDTCIGLKNIDIIAGTASSGISLASFVSARTEKPMIYVRSKTKEHGRKKQIEGPYEKGKKVVILTDVVSTQDDVVVAVNALKNEGMDVLACVAIHDNQMKTTNEFLKKNKIPLYALTNLQVLVEQAGKMRFITPAEKNILSKWLEKPEKWLEEREKQTAKTGYVRKKCISEMLLDTGAVMLSPSEPYRFASGIISPIYTDNRTIMGYPRIWKKIIDEFANYIANNIGRQNVDVIAGTDSAGISHAAYLASVLHLPMAYIKSEETPYGTRNKIEGVIKPGDRVVIVEDLISTGKSSIAAAETARNAGAVVDYCLAIFDYGLDASKKAFSGAKLELISMTNVNSLLDVALSKKAIDEKEKKLVLDWQKGPEVWGEMQAL